MYSGSGDLVGATPLPVVGLSFRNSTDVLSFSAFGIIFILFLSLFPHFEPSHVLVLILSKCIEIVVILCAQLLIYSKAERFEILKRLNVLHCNTV